MSTFYGAVLVGSISAGRMDSKTTLFRYFSNFRIVVKFSTLIQMNTSIVSNTLTWSKMSKGVVELIEWKCVGFLTLTDEVSSEVILDKYPASFTVKTKIIMTALLIFRSLS